MVEEFDHPVVVVGEVQRQRSAVPSAAWSPEGLNVPVPDVAGSTAGSAHHAHGGRCRASHSLPPPVQSVHTAALTAVRSRRTLSVAPESPCQPKNLIMTGSIDPADGGHAVVDIVGPGPPLFWFEGGPGFPADLGLPDVALLADRFTCYLINPPGVGGSRLASGQPAPDHLGHARLYEQILQALDLGPVLAIGPR